MVLITENKPRQQSIVSPGITKGLGDGRLSLGTKELQKRSVDCGKQAWRASVQLQNVLVTTLSTVASNSSKELKRQLCRLARTLPLHSKLPSKEQWATETGLELQLVNCECLTLTACLAASIPMIRSRTQWLTCTPVA